MRKVNSIINSSFLWPVFSILMLIKYGYHNFRYYPILDDWIQYGSYRLEDNIFNNIILAKATYMTRPLASLSDVYIWAKLWDNMFISLILITILHIASAYFLYKVIEHFKIEVGVPFLLIYGLLPLGSEATYWISASSRLVVGVFFMSVSLFFLIKHIENRQNRYLILFIIFHIISMGYYEQVSILSAFLAFAILVLSIKKLKYRWELTLPFINFALLVLYYKAFSKAGNVATRGQIVNSNFIDHFKNFFDSTLYVFGSVQIKLLKNGFTRGLSLLIENKSIMYILLVIAFSILIGYISYLKSSENTINRSLKRSIYSILFGFICFWIPLTLNALLSTIWICNRNVFTSFIGLAMIVEAFIFIIFRNKLGHILKAIILSIVCFVFLLVNISEIDDYKRASEIDYNISSQIIDKLDKDILSGQKNIILFNGQSTYIDQNSYHHDHIHNVTASDWAMTGALRAVSENLMLKQVIMHPWAGANTLVKDDKWSSSLILGVDKAQKLHILTAKKVDDINIELYKEDGLIFGIAERTSDQGHYYFHIK